MTIYLAEDELGRSTDAIGYPNLQVCHAIMLRTPTALYGCHFAAAGSVLVAELAAALRSIILRREDPAGGICLYGCCDFTRRFAAGGETAWKSEMRLIAGILGHTRTVSGFDTGTIDPGQVGSYVEYRFNQAKTMCHIYYRKHDQMQYAVEKRSNMPNYSRSVNRWTITKLFRERWNSPTISAVETGSWNENDNLNVTFSAQPITPNTGLIELDYGLRLKIFAI